MYCLRPVAAGWEGDTLVKGLLVYAGLASVACIWGFNFLVSRLSMDKFDPVLFTFLRFGLAVPVLFAILKWKEGSIAVARKDIPALAAIGLFGVSVLEMATMYCIRYTTLANSSMLSVAPWPIFAALFAPLFIKERMTKRLAAGGAIALAGVVFVIGGSAGGMNFSSSNMFGNLLSLGVSIVGALYNLAAMPLMKRYSSLRVTSWYALFGSLFLLPFTRESWQAMAPGNLTALDAAAIGYNVLFCTVFAFVAWNACMQKVGAARANFFRYLVPFTATLLGFIFLKEPFTVWQGFGAALMTAGLVFISMDKSAAAPAARNTPLPD